MPLGVLLIVLGAATNGSFAVPMKRMRGWAWAHSWFVWSFSGLLVVPLAAGLLTIPDLAGVYQATSWNSLLRTAVFGFLWGVSGVLFGLGISQLGLALGFGIIIGISSALGAIGPLLATHREQLFTSTGLLTLAGVAVIVTGVAACAVAGRIRETARQNQAGGSVTKGLLICVASGVMAPMMNFGLAYGSEIQEHARRLGAGESHLANALWPVLLSAGFLANASYCGWLMSRRDGWRPLVAVSPASNLSRGFLMGLLWMAGLLLYGYGSRMLGSLGLILGWPVMMGCTVLTANAWGVATGEWVGASRAAKRWVTGGVILLVAGVLIISMAGGRT